MQGHPIQPHTDVTWFRDVVLLAEKLRKCANELDELDEHIREALNAAYQQGVRDAVEHRTGVDPIHGHHHEEGEDDE